MYRNRHPFTDDVLTGPTAEVTATIKLSYARLFTPKRIRKIAETFRLGPRDTDALLLAVKRISDTRAAKTLGLSPHTVRVHRSKMYAKLGVTSAERAALKFVLWIKVRDDGPRQARYIPFAQYLWEQANGPVPAGHFIVHANHNLMDDRLENLICVDRAEHVRRLRERPDVESRRRKRCSAASKQRHRENREAKRFARSQQRKARTVRECMACGAELPRGAPQCHKCGSTAIEERKVLPMPESVYAEAMEREVADGL